MKLPTLLMPAKVPLERKCKITLGIVGGDFLQKPNQGLLQRIDDDERRTGPEKILPGPGMSQQCKEMSPSG